MGAQPFHGLSQTIKALTQLGQAGACGICQFQRPVISMEQLDLEVFLQCPDLVADGSRRHIELDCGFFHAQMAGCGLKGLQRIQGWQSL